jgi:hypothetical protein
VVILRPASRRAAVATFEARSAASKSEVGSRESEVDLG